MSHVNHYLRRSKFVLFHHHKLLHAIVERPKWILLKEKAAATLYQNVALYVENYFHVVVDVFSNVTRVSVVVQMC